MGMAITMAMNTTAMAITPAHPAGGDALAVTIGAAPSVLAGAQLGYTWKRNGAAASTAVSIAAGTIKAGESWSETPGARHQVSRNPSKTEPAKLLAVFVVDSGDKPLTTPIE